MDIIHVDIPVKWNERPNKKTLDAALNNLYNAANKKVKNYSENYYAEYIELEFENGTKEIILSLQMGKDSGNPNFPENTKIIRRMKTEF